MDPNANRIPIEVDIPLIFTPSSRDNGLVKDSIMENVFIDKDPDNEYWVTKRPGLSTYISFLGGGAATGQGLWFYNNFLLAAASNLLTRVSSGTSIGYTTGAGWNNTFNGPFQGRRDHCCVVLNGQMFVFGGTLDGVFYLNDVWATRDGQNWTQLTGSAPWGLRALASACVFNNRIYMMGGVTVSPTGTTSTFMNDVWVTDDGVTWSQLTTAAGWAPRAFPCCLSFNNGIWIFGGTATPNTDVWFSTDGSHWSQVSQTSPWTGGVSASGLVYNGFMWMIGGAVGARGNEVWRTPDGITWVRTTAAAFPSGRFGLGSCVYNNAMWVMNGFDGGYLQAVYWSTDGIVWNLGTGAYGGTARFRGTLAVFQAPPGVSPFNATTMYYIGGQDVTPVYYNQIWWASLGGTLSTTYTITGATTPFLPMQAVPANDNQYLVIKDERGAYIWYQNNVLQVTDKNYPSATVFGIVNLDETVYVMTPDALICGSNIQDPFTWPSRNFIGADYLSDGGTGIARYSNYLMALGTKSMQLFYNSGAPGPTLLRPMKNANADIGCVFPYTIVETIGTVLWVGNSEMAGKQVFIMDGLAPKPISIPLIDRILDSLVAGGASVLRATAVMIKGHPFYILTLPGQYSFAFDLKEQRWYKWTVSIAGTPLSWNCHAAATDGSNNFFLEDAANIVDVLTLGVFTDKGQMIQITLQSPNQDNGTGAWKTCGRLDVVMDRDPASAVFISYSDDDYQTFSAPRTLVVDATRTSDTRFGRYRRRAWKLVHNIATNFRAKKLRAHIRIGNN